MVTIRQFEVGDSIEALTDLLHRAYAHYGQRGLNVTAVDQTPEQTLERALAGVCFLGFDGPTLVGTLALRGPFPQSQCALLTQPHVCYISQYAVEPSHQRAGIGTLLHEAARRCALEDGFTLQAGDIPADTPPHQLDWFVKKQGFSLLDRFRWEGKNYDSLLIARRLDLEPFNALH